jgi:quinohemoprotein ethanol dehydrogenase
MSFSPDTGLTYIPVRELADYYNDIGLNLKTYDMKRDGALGLNSVIDNDAPKNAGSSSLIAWDAVHQKKAWEAATPGLTNGGVLSTHGGLVFQGQADGKLLARDADTGAVLWSTDMGVGTQAPPITYSVGGQQYVSILDGWAGMVDVFGSLSAQHGWVGRSHPRRLLTYVLDGNAPLPQTPPPSVPTPIDDPAFNVDPALAQKGSKIYGNCILCHGLAVVSGGYAPDLRASSVPLSAQAFKAIVHDGGLEARGMPKFDELSDNDLEALRHYIRARARYKPSVLSQLGDIWHFAVLQAKMTAARVFAKSD